MWGETPVPFQIVSRTPRVDQTPKVVKFLVWGLFFVITVTDWLGPAYKRCAGPKLGEPLMLVATQPYVATFWKLLNTILFNSGLGPPRTPKSRQAMAGIGGPVTKAHLGP